MEIIWTNQTINTVYEINETTMGQIRQLPTEILFDYGFKSKDSIFQALKM